MHTSIYADGAIRWSENNEHKCYVSVSASYCICRLQYCMKNSLL